MFIAYAVIAVLLALGLTGSAFGKLSRQPKMIEIYTALDVPLGILPFLAACEIAGAAGLVIGLWWGPLGIAAAVGVVLYFIGAIGAHVRGKDLKGLPAPTVFLILAAVAVALRASTL